MIEGAKTTALLRCSATEGKGEEERGEDEGEEGEPERRKGMAHLEEKRSRADRTREQGVGRCTVYRWYKPTPRHHGLMLGL